MMEYLSHGEAVEYVQRMAGLSRETFDFNIRPRLIERAYSDRVSRFKRVAIDKAIDDPTFEEGPMIFKRRDLGELLDHVYKTEWQLQKGARKQKNLVEQITRELGAKTPLKKITYNRLEEWVIALRESGLSDATIARRLTTVTKALRVAKVKEWIKTVPERPRISIKNTKDRFISPDEENALLNTAKRQAKLPSQIMPRVMRILMDTGCRVSELVKSLPQDVTDDGIIFPDRKGGDKIKVSLTATARQALSELHNDRWWRRMTRDVHHKEKGIRDLAIENLQNRLTHWFTAIRNAADIPVSLHTYRHTCASRLVQAGYDIFKVQKWLGHQDISMTTRRYAHLQPDSLSEGASILESYASDNVVSINKRRILED